MLLTCINPVNIICRMLPPPDNFVGGLVPIIFVAAANCSSSATSIVVQDTSYTVKSVGGVVPNPLFTAGTVVMCALDTSTKTISFFGKAGDTGLLDSDLTKATATASDVMSGKIFYAGNATLKTGSSTNKEVFRGSVSASKYSGSTITIPFVPTWWCFWCSNQSSIHGGPSFDNRKTTTGGNYFTASASENNTVWTFVGDTANIGNVNVSYVFMKG